MELNKKAQKIVANDVVTEDYSDSLVGELMWERFHLAVYSGRKIPQYLNENEYYRHSLDDWVDHHRAMWTIRLIGEATEENLHKYGLEHLSTPFIYTVDNQYARLKEKTTEVVQRFKGFNESKMKKSFCSKVFGETKADANYHACRRVLVERSAWNRK